MKDRRRACIWLDRWVIEGGCRGGRVIVRDSGFLWRRFFFRGRRRRREIGPIIRIILQRRRSVGNFRWPVTKLSIRHLACRWSAPMLPAPTVFIHLTTGLGSWNSSMLFFTILYLLGWTLGVRILRCIERGGLPVPIGTEISILRTKG
jgi:hypothetical protein